MGKELIKNILIMLGFIFIAIQFVPVNRSNPPVEEEITAPGEVKAILKRACFDCHSNETRWPWYSQVAPVSWLVSEDVHEGRKHMNFSEWERLSEDARSKTIKHAWHEVEEGEMPLWFYVPLHPKARLSEDDKRVLREWAQKS